MRIEPQTQFGRTAIPKTLHVIWVGDESKRPENGIDTWRVLNPDWEIKLWGRTRQSYDELHRLTIGDGLAASTGKGGGAAAAENSAAPPARSPLQDLHDPCFVQQVPVSADLVGVDRLSVLARLCAGQRVLHVGCADWPITDPRTSLHVALEPICAKLDGFDVQEEALAALAPYVKGKLTARLEELTDEYDIVLVPEVMEHVGNVESFLKQLDAIDASAYLLSVPDAYSAPQATFPLCARDGHLRRGRPSGSQSPVHALHLPQHHRQIHVPEPRGHVVFQ